MTTTEDYRTAAIFARVMGSNAGSFGTSHGAPDPFTATPVAHVVRIDHRWRVKGCPGCSLINDQCARCAVLFVGIDPGITFPSLHTDQDWRLAHQMHMNTCTTCNVHRGLHAASCSHYPSILSRMNDDL